MRALLFIVVPLKITIESRWKEKSHRSRFHCSQRTIPLCAAKHCSFDNLNSRANKVNSCSRPLILASRSDKKVKYFRSRPPPSFLSRRSERVHDRDRDRLLSFRSMRKRKMTCQHVILERVKGSKNCWAKWSFRVEKVLIVLRKIRFRAHHASAILSGSKKMEKKNGWR